VHTREHKKGAHTFKLHCTDNGTAVLKDTLTARGAPSTQAGTFNGTDGSVITYQTEMPSLRAGGRDSSHLNVRSLGMHDFKCASTETHWGSAMMLVMLCAWNAC